MMTTETFLQVDAAGGRIDRLAGHLASAAVGLGPEMIDAIITDALRQLCDVLEADYASLEGTSDDSMSAVPRRAWTRHGAKPGSEPAVTIRVAASDGSSFTLSIGGGKRTPWPAAVGDGLRALAHVMVLIVLRAQQMQELERIRFTLSSTGASAGRVFGESWDSDDFENIIGDSPALRFAIARVQEVAPTDASVMLLGETGTGKELFARAVHNRSTRRGRPFVSVNCAALPATLIETELFGHVRGAFTGAVAMRQGRFELADGGTLFLDEIGDLPPDVQAKLLRVLQEGQFERVGASQSRKVDVRIVAATHHNLEAAMKEGRFRADLYYRLNVFPIVLPPLRERLEDLPRLVWYFVNRRQRALNRKFTSIPDHVFAALAERSWPGNVHPFDRQHAGARRSVVAAAICASPRLGHAGGNGTPVRRGRVAALSLADQWPRQRGGSPRAASEHTPQSHEEVRYSAAKGGCCVRSGAPVGVMTRSSRVEVGHRRW
jgi:transcriptional regulator with GAF, ATPase, and Fis domain